ncbi:putative pyruvate decarboxylase [Aspergillus nomiae NRRL 13137]|uniref:Pyruvate decarboxylase n=1 Tax=Aspergillus nomiae NRRL (strain ATCC 15546 / NRRL 13137 / CBS 260.88 / M93) TaxID=1509407 RepID=A0A0L1JFF6_ASPN3|nr:putative pyruvate decarboxylase [Aspergillus nomiae NRRL 13137]KNG90456.1 putative pyruvate decarboxylase [Aspergillus nomiae NRRL 13137]
MALDIRVSAMKTPIDIAEYLFTRLHQLGVRTIQGVPGDYNLAALDYIPKVGLTWVGNCNELNAGYSADAYARIKGISAIITTFGVGELSALNAIAGAYSEHVPVVHIVGQPSTASQRDGMLLHHTLGNSDYNVFTNISANLAIMVAKITDPHDAPALIDHTLRECWIQSQPVYIALPTDMVQQKVEGELLLSPIDLTEPLNEPEEERYVVDVVMKYLHAAKSPVILVDAGAIRHNALEYVHELIQKSGFPTFVTPMGKGAVDETLPNFGGVYAGTGSNEGVAARVESADLILSIGPLKSDFNTTGFSYRTSRLNTIDFYSDHVQVRYSLYPKVRMRGILEKVIQEIGGVSISPTSSSFCNTIPSGIIESRDGPITHSWLWPVVGNWLREGDIVITETGTANFGIWEARFPRGVTAISQVLWGSIGYSVGACLGAALAVREAENRRVILFVGDGSFQMTAQEVSTMIRQNLNPIIFVICNDGYTIERYIHGWGEEYNNIQPWKHAALVQAFGAEGPHHYSTYQASTRNELTLLLNNQQFAFCPHFQLVELYMPKDDAPAALKLTAEAAAARNSQAVE